MPTTGRSRGRPRKTPTLTQKQLDKLELELEEDGELEEIEPPKIQRTPKKNINISTLVSETLSDRLSATASYAISSSMLNTVGPEYAISPKEAYNLTHPTANIIAHYVPINIKTKLPADIADNLELIIVTFLEYVSRVTATFVQKQFNMRLRRHGLQSNEPTQRTMPKPEPRQPISTPVQDEDHSPPVSVEDIQEMFLPGQTETVQTQVPNGRTGLSFEDLIADGLIIGDTGQAL